MKPFLYTNDMNLSMDSLLGAERNLFTLPAMDHAMNFHPQLVLDRVRILLGRLEQRIHQPIATLAVAGSVVLDEAVPWDQLAGVAFQPVPAGSYFGDPGGSFKQRWFRLQIPVAGPDQGGRRVLHWRGAGELTVYRDGQAIGAFDPCHGHLPIEDDAHELYLDCSTCQTHMHPKPRHGGLRPDAYGLRFDAAELLLRDATLWTLFWDIFVLHDALLHQLASHGGIDGIGRKPIQSVHNHFKAPMHDVPVRERRWLRQLDRICDRYRVDDLVGAQALVRELYADYPAECWQARATMTGHGHLDYIFRGRFVFFSNLPQLGDDGFETHAD